MVKQTFPENYKPVIFGSPVGLEDEQGAGGGVATNQGGKIAKLFIWGDIGGWWGVWGGEVYDALVGRKEIEHIDLYISSNGGSIVHAFQIHDILAGHPATVTAHIFSLAASSATIICAAADKRVMSRQALYMIHEGATFMYGYYQVDEMIKEVNALNSFNGRIVDLYGRQTGLEENPVRAFMKAETFFEPDQALEAGFIDEVVDFVAVPFDEMNVDRTMFESFFYNHTAQAAKALCMQQGFAPMAASMIRDIKTNNIKGQASGAKPQKPLNSKFMNFAELFQNFLVKLGVKNLTTQDGTVLEGDKIAEHVQAADQEELAALVVGAQGDQVSDLISTAIAQAENRLDEKVDGLTTRLDAAEAQAAKDKDTIAKLKADLAAVKLARTGQGGDQDDTTQVVNDAPNGEEVNKVFGEGSMVYNTLVSNGIVTKAQLKKIERDAAAKRAAMKAAQ